MSSRRLKSAAAAALAAVIFTSVPAAQEPSIEEVLKRSAAYVADFRKQLSGIVAEETYTQEITYVSRIGVGNVPPAKRTLKSDLLLIKPSDADRHVELRDVYEVNGSPVRDRERRLESLLKQADGGAHIGEIISESARYNIGNIQRNINTPLMALMFLDSANQSRFRYKHIPKAGPVFTDSRDTTINEAPVFRVSTEMWTVEYQERGRGTIIRAPDGRDRPAKGRFWINPATGGVLISELIIDAGGVLATVTVSYQSEPLMGFLVPVEMRESYVRYPERITGHATYGKFRALQ